MATTSRTARPSSLTPAAGRRCCDRHQPPHRCVRAGGLGRSPPGPANPHVRRSRRRVGGRHEDRTSLHRHTGTHHQRRDRLGRPRIISAGRPLVNGSTPFMRRAAVRGSRRRSTDPAVNPRSSFPGTPVCDAGCSTDWCATANSSSNSPTRSTTAARRHSSRAGHRPGVRGPRSSGCRQHLTVPVDALRPGPRRTSRRDQAH